MHLGNTRDCPHMKYGTGDTPLWNGIEYAVEWNRVQQRSGLELRSGIEYIELRSGME